LGWRERVANSSRNSTFFTAHRLQSAAQSRLEI
jgi:hypothetical protein